VRTLARYAVSDASIFTVKLNLFNATLFRSRLQGQLDPFWSFAATPAFRVRVQSKSFREGLAHNMHMHRETLNERMPLLTLLRALDDVQVGRALVDRPPVIFDFSTCPWSVFSRN
jgi:hypothetical protein